MSLIARTLTPDFTASSRWVIRAARRWACNRAAKGAAVTEDSIGVRHPPGLESNDCVTSLR
ncbi:hypothetical protein Aco03nite_009440 [Actinoplanes couchii]|uniref:Uncharacterized protein n=1 Tax=Actinoplanes couchii TaxID=403638 RepID=A0ABQ3X1Z3_9ACTN|nr:hypothetical protein Aco03nite_009440 [Actinoplanes couchii]